MGHVMLSPPSTHEVLSRWHGLVLPAPTMKTILADVAEHYQISALDILSEGSYRDVVFPRYHFMWECRQVFWASGKHRYSFPMIAAFLSRNRSRLMDHTTVMHGCARHEERRAAWGLFFHE